MGYGYVGSWNLGFRVYKENPEAEIGQWPLPGGPSARGKDFGQYIAMHTVIPTDARQAEAGWRWILHDASPQGQQHIQWSASAFDITAIPSVANGAAGLRAQPWRKRMNELMAEAKHPSYFPHPGSGEIGTAITTAVQPFLRGEEGPKATLEAPSARPSARWTASGPRSPSRQGAPGSPSRQGQAGRMKRKMRAATRSARRARKVSPRRALHWSSLRFWAAGLG